MKTVALLTDFGLEDNFVGVIKGVILKINPDVNLVDITHCLPRHAVKKGAFLIAESFAYFPRGTVFLAVVDPGVGSSRRPIALKTKKHYFVGPDNGILSIAAKAAGIESIVTLNKKKYFLENVSSTFHGRDIFAPAAAHLSSGVPLSFLGRKAERIKLVNLPRACLKRNTLEGKVIYSDKFGNLVTNIKKDSLLRFLKGRPFSATLKRKAIKKIYFSYAQGIGSQPFFIEGGFGYLEVSLKNSSAKNYFRLKDNEEAVLAIKRLAL